MLEKMEREGRLVATPSQYNSQVGSALKSYK